jgi:hypothetical protein
VHNHAFSASVINNAKNTFQKYGLRQKFWNSIHFVAASERHIFLNARVEGYVSVLIGS